MTRILLIRHGATDSVGKRFSGRTQGVQLNEEGRRQAAGLVERLVHLPIRAIYSSPLERTVDTAAPLAKALVLPVNKAEELIEIDCGDWTNREIESLAGDRQFQLFNTYRSVAAIPGGEWMLDAQVRVVRFLQKLSAQHANETVAVVSHGDVIRAALLFYAGIPLDLLLRIEVDPASVSIVTLFDETARINLMNHTGDIR